MMTDVAVATTTDAVVAVVAATTTDAVVVAAATTVATIAIAMMTEEAATGSFVATPSIQNTMISLYTIYLRACDHFLTSYDLKSLKLEFSDLSRRRDDRRDYDRRDRY
jgi:uncharacterized membrane protein (GlpM family)